VLVLALLFLVVPVLELYVIVQVASGIGVPETILLLIGISVVGAWLAKREGIGVLRRVQATVAQGRVPSGEIVDGALVLLAGALMITPGFLSDCLAVLLLLPPTRAVVRATILRRIRAGGRLVRVMTVSGPGPRRADVWDVEGWEDPPPPTDRPPLGP
jgi:UPF0716 protein FxsA